jgi:hypothetical protein
LSETIVFAVIIIINKNKILYMQGIYTYILEKNHGHKEYIDAAVLSLLFMVPISLASDLVLMLFFTSALSAVCVQCPIWQFSVVP